MKFAMRYYRTEKKPKTKNRRRQSWGSSHFGMRKNGRVRHYDEAAFLGSSGLYRHQKTKPLHVKSLIFGSILIIWLGFLIYSPFFKIFNVDYSGNKIISTDQIENIVKKHITPKYNFYPTNQYFLVNAKEIYDDLLVNLPLESTKVEKIFPNTLRISIVEKNSSIIYDNGESYFLLDHEGKLLKYLDQVKVEELNPTSTTSIKSNTSTSKLIQIKPSGTEFARDYPNLPIFVNSNDAQPTKDNSSVDQKIISSIIDFDRGIRQGTDIKIRYYEPDFIKADLIAVTDLGWLIKFTVDRSIDSQLAAFRSIYKASSPVEYIDIRLEDRLFWK
jgi:hypothetical protein